MNSALAMPSPIKFVLMPLLLAQAAAVRRRALILPEAEGPREGHLGLGEPALKLLLVGDSSAAGVGVDHQERALAGHLVRALHLRLGRPLAWTVQAGAGLNTREVHDMLRSRSLPSADVALVATGVNDLIDQIPASEAVRSRAELADWLAKDQGIRHVVFAPLPPVHRFPLLPQPLRHIAGADARRHDRAMARWVAARQRERGDVSHVPIPLVITRENMARDGFHPGEPVYRVCGEVLAEHIATRVWPALNPGSAPAPVATRPLGRTAAEAKLRRPNIAWRRASKDSPR